jgi:RNA polymerase sigma-70 factor, ECF subfamily
MTENMGNLVDGAGSAPLAGIIRERVTPRPPVTMDEVTVRDLVEHARRGNQEAFTMLFKRFHEEIYRYATRRLGDPDAGQDVAAETMADAFSGIHRFRWRGVPFEAWLYTIARRRSVDRLRSQVREPRDDIPADASLPDHSDAVVESARIRAAIAELPPTERDVVELRFMEDLDVEQTALRLGKRAGAVRVAQHRALVRLRASLEGASR